MQNEFEKQVKQKMEELDFVPSTPVWQKIEEQIRHKKERRRIIFWLPLLLLSIVGGITWLALNGDEGSKMAVETKTSDLAKPQLPKTSNGESTGSSSGTVRNLTGEDNSTIKVHEQPGTFVQTPSAPIATTVKIKKTQVGRKQFNKNDASGSRQSVAGYGNQERKNIVSLNERVHFNTGQNILNEKTVNQNQEKSHSEPVKNLQGDTAARIIETVTNPQDFIEKKTGLIDVKESGNLDSVLTEAATPMVRNFGKSKWKLGVIVKAGVSGTVKGLDLNTSKSMEYLYAPNSAPPPPPALYSRSYGPSETRNKASYGAGFQARKQLNKRLAFVTGLQYQYVAASVKVGYKRPTLATGNTSNFQDSYSALALVDYTNKFHFISLPLAMDFQLLKRKPLNLQAGVSYQKLIATNAVYFDYASQLYIQDRNYFSDGQIFTELGIHYTFPVKKMPLSVGPYLQYSITALDKNTNKQYLYSLGLKTSILFQKK